MRRRKNQSRPRGAWSSPIKKEWERDRQDRERSRLLCLNQTSNKETKNCGILFTFGQIIPNWTGNVNSSPGFLSYFVLLVFCEPTLFCPDLFHFAYFVYLPVFVSFSLSGPYPNTKWRDRTKLDMHVDFQEFKRWWWSKARLSQDSHSCRRQTFYIQKHFTNWRICTIPKRFW